MATTKSLKLQAEIDKARAKLAEQQARVRELEAKRTEMENTEIVDIVRGMSIPLDDLAVLLQSLRSGTTAATYGQLVHMSKPVENTSIPDDTEEEPE